MTKGNATTNTPPKGGARLANVSTTSDESVKRKIRQKVYYARGEDFTRKEKLEMLRSQCSRGRECAYFCGDRERK
jgi:hypothetical protein